MPIERLPPMVEADRETLARVLLFCFERSKAIFPTGSRVLGGASVNSDYDYVIDASNIMDATRQYLVQLGFTPADAEREYGDRGSKSFRCGNLNLIVCRGSKPFNNWSRATDVAKLLRPRTKAERILVFESVFGEREFFHSFSSTPSTIESEGQVW